MCCNIASFASPFSPFCVAISAELQGHMGPIARQKERGWEHGDFSSMQIAGLAMMQTNILR